MILTRLNEAQRAQLLRHQNTNMAPFGAKTYVALVGQLFLPALLL
jgi:hypothetical protein